MAIPPKLTLDFFKQQLMSYENNSSRSKELHKKPDNFERMIFMVRTLSQGYPQSPR